jgi:beta-galactosidase GanA
VIYVGTLLEPGFYVDLARRACAGGKVDLGPELPQGMDCALRQNDKGSFRFLLNFSESPKIVKVAGQHRDLISAKLFQDEVTVPPLDLRVLVANRSN